MERRHSTKPSYTEQSLEPPWTLQQFIGSYEPYITPEVLVLIFVESLLVLEGFHRRGRFHGVLDAQNILIDQDGLISLTTPKGVTVDQIAATRFTDLVMIGKTFFDLILRYNRSRARIHPWLEKILYRAGGRERKAGYNTAWDLRADLLDFLQELSLEGFFLVHFIEAPAAFNRSVGIVMGDRQVKRVEKLIRHRHRKQALSELYFLLEVTPTNVAASKIFSKLKQGRTLLLARMAYVAAIVGLIVLGASVFLENYRGERSKPLLIEPVPARRSPNAESEFGESNAKATGSIEIIQKSRSIPGLSVLHPDKGLVSLELDPDTLAYFDGRPGEVPARSNGAQIWLSAGTHSITVTKKATPPVIGQIEVKPGSSTEIIARLVANP
ncbi:MAG: hypothetical protein AB1540_13155 [Bdellovibrionota bacterium]